MSEDSPRGGSPDAPTIPDTRGLRLHQELVEALDDYVFMADTSGRILAVNRKAREALGWEEDEIGSMTIWDLHPAEDKAKVERERWRIVDSGASSFEVHLLTKSGRAIPTRGHVTYSPASGTFQGVYRDITEEQLMSEHLLQVERLRALGEMASGVAHTFNNLLAVIGTTVQVAKRMTADEPLRQQLVAIEQAVYDGGRAVRRIQDFVRRHPGEPYQELDVNAIVEEAARAAAERARAAGGIQITTELLALPRVKGSASEMRDVLLNLLFNAIDAMPEGGPIVLRTRPGTRVAIEVVDRGRGMSDEVRQRLFTPFFSTKGERGSGLGLAIALNVVAQHGGSIEVDSAPGQGTTMRVLLPEATAAPGSETCRILLAETEPLLRMQISRAVSREGHTVETVDEGAAALRLLDEAAFDVVFAELTLGSVGGMAVADRARARGARVVLLAGWSDKLSEEELRAHRIDAVLRKPFPVSAVLNLIHGLGRRGR